MSFNVKCPRVPHQWDKIGQRLGQLRTVEPFSSATVFQVQGNFTMLEGRNFTYMFPKQHYKSGLWETKPGTRNSPPADTHLHTHRPKKVIVASIFPQENGHLQFQLCSLPFNDSISLPLFSPVSSSSPKHPHFVLPESSPSGPGSIWLGNW